MSVANEVFTQEANVMKFKSINDDIKDDVIKKDNKKEEKNLNEVHMVENGVRKHQEKGQK